MDAPVMMLLPIMLGALAGALIAYVHLRTLAPSVRWMAEGRAAAAIGLQALRLALLAAALVVIAKLSSVALIAAVVALVVTRTVLVRLAARRFA